MSNLEIIGIKEDDAYVFYFLKDNVTEHTFATHVAKNNKEAIKSVRNNISKFKNLQKYEKCRIRFQ